MNLVTDKRQLLNGIELLDTAVSSTLGPKGRTVVIQKDDNSLHLTKDGVTVSNFVKSDNPVEQIGIDLVKKAASIAVEKTGDGTTTATVLACELIRECYKLSSKSNPYVIRKGMQAAYKEISKHIDYCKNPVRDKMDMVSIASIAANNDERVGELVGSLMYKLGEDSVVSVNTSNTLDTTVDYVNGYSFDKGLINNYFVTDASQNKAVLKDVKILLYDKKLSNISSVIHLIQGAQQDNKSLLIIADDIDDDAIAILTALSVNKSIKVAVVRAPNYGDAKYETLEDISIYTGGIVLSETKGINLINAKYDYLGSAEEVIITGDKTVILGGYGSEEDIDIRVGQIRSLISPDLSSYKSDAFKQRIANLKSSIAEIKVGGASDIEKLEVKDRIDDAIGACKSAKKYGIVKGGSFILYDFYLKNKNVKPVNNDIDYLKGFNLVIKSIIKPCVQIISNAGYNPKNVLKLYERNYYKKDNNNMSFNSVDGIFQSYNDSYIFDPAEVVKVSLKSAIDIASEFITFNCVILNNKENEREVRSNFDEQIY